MLSFLKPKPKNLLPADVNEAVVKAIREVEQKTSGEIRVYVESKCRFVDPLDRAVEVFRHLKMQETKERNAVLIYLALDDRQLAIFADENIYSKLGKKYWEKEVKHMQVQFKQQQICSGLVNTIYEVGEELAKIFPYHNNDKNEIPDEIVFGK